MLKQIGEREQRLGMLNAISLIRAIFSNFLPNGIVPGISPLYDGSSVPLEVRLAPPVWNLRTRTHFFVGETER